MKKYGVIGLMSGTSLDGLDIAFCEFQKKKTWQYKIIHAETKKYNIKWKNKLSKAYRSGKVEIEKLDVEYGMYIGKEVLRFINRYKIPASLIASHGHTVFHRPENGITLQIGDGASIASVCRLPVVYDFRSGDVALGGQGAPLVPLVDKMLFSQYDYCLNLGGFANISYASPLTQTFGRNLWLSRERGTLKTGLRYAFDICPVNIVLNELAGKLGKEFDKGGKIASKGTVNTELLKKLNAIPFYKISPPKSLGREWVENKFLPVLNSFRISSQDKLRTAVEHVAVQIALAVNCQLPTANCRLLITGGGAYNDFLIERIAFHTSCKIVLPDDKTIQFKEAMAFAFLGVLKMRGEINILKSVTGAKRDSSGGKIYFPDQKAVSSL